MMAFERTSALPSGEIQPAAGEARSEITLPDDFGGIKRGFTLPDDYGGRNRSIELPDDSGKYGKLDRAEDDGCFYDDLSDMKRELGMSYGELKADKPPHSPNLAKWFDSGGAVQVGEENGQSKWVYRDAEGREVAYIDGYPVFPEEAKHPVIGDLNIGEFTGDRNEDKQLYREKLQEEYGLTEIPDGYALHHDSENGNMQLVKADWHSEFTHSGGHSRFKEAE